MKIANGIDAAAARIRTRQIGHLLGLDRNSQVKMATAVCEVARNALKFASGGELQFSIIGHEEPFCLEARMCDRGPGIKNLNKAFAEISGGLSRAKLLVDDLQIETGKSGTTCILLKKVEIREGAFSSDQIKRVLGTLNRASAQPVEELFSQNDELLQALSLLRRQSEAMESIVNKRTRELSEAKLFAELLIDSISDGLIVADSQGRLTYLNESARNLYPDISSKTDARLLDSDGNPLTAESCPIQRALAGQSITDFEITVLEQDKSRVLSADVRPFLRSGGKVDGAVMTLRDVTIRKQIELALKRGRDEAIAENEARSLFLDTVSHEFRTPMAGIIGLVELISLTSAESDTQFLSKNALTSCKRLLQILNDLVEASSLKFGQISLQPRFFPVRPVIGDLVQVADRKGLTILPRVADDVPADVCGDEYRVRQILSNLLFNAVKFTNAGQIVVEVATLTQTETCSTLKFTVRDTGIGISKEQKSKLFYPFSQAEDSTKRIYGGTGLGLSISKNLVELMGGKLVLKASPSTARHFGS